MNAQNYYQQKSQEIQVILEKLKQKRNGLTLLKIIFVFSALYLLYIFSNTSNFLYLHGTIFCAILFIGSNILESKILKKISFFRELKKCSETETAYLKGDYSFLQNGEEFKTSNHPYAFDLDIFGENSLYQSLNRTITPGGNKLLRKWLLYPCKSKEEIITRQQAVAELSNDPNWCHAFRAIGQQFYSTKNKTQEIFSLENEDKPFPLFIRLIIYLLPILTILGWILAIFSIMVSTIPLYLSLIQLIIVSLHVKKINRYHHQLDLFLRSFGNLHELIQHFSTRNNQTQRLQDLCNTLFGKEQNALVASKLLHRILEGFDQRGNILGMLITNGLFMRDLHLTVRIIHWQSLHTTVLHSWIEAINELDVFVSLANYYYNHPDYTFPLPDSTLLLQGTNIGHPLIPKERCVTNDFQISRLHEFHIITGANMAGKSTFLRAVGVNLVLAHMGCVVHAQNFKFQPMELFSSMRTVDNLAKGTSYFHAELLRLKQLIETAQKEERLFIILDEILKGTNSVDKLNGSRQFLEKLLTLPVAGLIATHDLELGKLEERYPDNFSNKCFEITHTDDDITYDYKLKKGISQNMNASILLKKMGLV